MSRSRMFCPDCGTDLDVTVGDACPGCGGDRREAVVAPEIISTVAVTDEVSYVITKGDQRPWAEQWQRLLRQRDVLKSAYSLEGLGSSLDLENIINSFFCECFHLRDWLKGDIAALSAVTAKDVDDHIHASSPLSIARACYYWGDPIVENRHLAILNLCDAHTSQQVLVQSDEVLGCDSEYPGWRVGEIVDVLTQQIEVMLVSTALHGFVWLPVHLPLLRTVCNPYDW